MPITNARSQEQRILLPISAQTINGKRKGVRGSERHTELAAARPGDRSGGGSPSLARAGSEDVREGCNLQTMPALGGVKAGMHVCLANPVFPRIRVWSSASTLEKMNN